MSFSAQDVKALRDKTGLGMMDCKKALARSDGDSVAAEEWMREERKGKMDTRTERATGEGLIGIKLGNGTAAMIEVCTETDFTARTDAFKEMVDAILTATLSMDDGEISADDTIQKEVDDVRITTGENVNFSRGIKITGGTFGSYVHHDGKRAVLLQVDGVVDAELLKGICQHIVFHDPMGIDEDSVPAEKIESIRADAIQQARDTGKPDEIAEKMSEGKVRKYLQEHTLVHQKYVLDESVTVGSLLPEGIAISSFVRYTLGG